MSILAAGFHSQSTQILIITAYICATVIVLVGCYEVLRWRFGGWQQTIKGICTQWPNLLVRWQTVLILVYLVVIFSLIISSSLARDPSVLQAWLELLILQALATEVHFDAHFLCLISNRNTDNDASKAVSLGNWNWLSHPVLVVCFRGLRPALLGHDTL